jgi:MFS family permease
MADQAPAAIQVPALRFSRSEILSILSGLMLAMFLASLDQTIVATSLSTMAQELNGRTLMSWVVSAYLVASTITTPIYGRLSDMYGQCPVLLASIGLFVAFAHIFLYAGAISAFTFLASFGLKEIPLRGS